jgi:electron transport complex protein RnfG
LVNAVVAVKRGEKTQPWQVDGITGATISSVAVADIVRNSASFWLPRIQGNLDVFKRGGTVDSGLTAGARLRVFDGGPQ